GERSRPPGAVRCSDSADSAKRVLDLSLVARRALLGSAPGLFHLRATIHVALHARQGGQQLGLLLGSEHLAELAEVLLARARERLLRSEQLVERLAVGLLIVA